MNIERLLRMIKDRQRAALDSMSKARTSRYDHDAGRNVAARGPLFYMSPVATVDCEIAMPVVTPTRRRAGTIGSVTA